MPPARLAGAVSGATGRARAALVTTLRGAAPVLDSFLRYHLALGFAHIHLFFDDADDPGIVVARGIRDDRIIVTVRGPELENAWRQCVQFGYFAAHLGTEVMSRQCLNVEVAVQWALARGDEWLLHIDADELFYCPGQDAPTHFSGLDAQHIERAVYPNLEALSERFDLDDALREVTLFKTNRNTLPQGRFTPAQAALAARHPQFPPTFFLFYSNGKSAARVRPGLVPDGVHRFSAGTYLQSGQSTPPSPPEAQGEQVIGDCRILHFACCGYSSFVDKYRILCRFDDRWFGRVDIRQSIGEFHLAARDAVASGDESRAQRFYREHAMLDDMAA
ncbi:MAG: glycosyltransferase family 2 protein, partial [Betaproteobacteria bacterium]